MSPSGPAQPLAGFRVLELSGRLTAFCGKVLADLGAEVLIVEPPGGDALRRLPPFRDGARPPESSLAFAYYHHNKRGITLDWRRPSAQPLLAELASRADVVLASPAGCPDPVTGFVEDPASFTWAGPGALTCLLTPFGTGGPYGTWRATPFTSFAMSGFMHPVGPPEGPPLAMPGQQFCDEAGIWGASLVQAALLGGGRRRGITIDLAVHEVGLLYRLGTEQYQLGGRIKTRETNFGAPPSGRWRCRDGWIDLGVHSPGQWEAFLEVVGRPPALCAELFGDRKMRIQLFDLVQEIVEELLAGREAAEFVESAQQAGLACTLSLDCGEVMRQEVLRERGYLVPSERLGTGRFDIPGPPFRSEPPLVGYARSAPSLGQDNVAVFVEALGHSLAELEGWSSDALV